MKSNILVALLFLYVLALHTSIALMEILSWAIFLTIIIYKYKLGKPLHFPFWKPLLALVVIVGLSLIFNPALKPFFQQFGFMRWVFLFWGFTWALEEVWSTQFEIRWMKWWICFLSLLGLYAFFQFLTGVDLIRPQAHVISSQGGGVWRPTGFYSMSLTYAYCVGASFFFILVPAFQLKNKIWPLLALVWGVVGVLSSMSRGAWIAMVVAGCFYFVLAQRKWLPHFLGFITVVFGGFALFSSSILTKIGDIFHGGRDHSSVMRQHLWKAYSQMFFDHPFLGVGLFQGDKLLPTYYKRLNIEESFASHAHNIYLQWAAGAGGLALVLFLYIVISMLIKSYKLAQKSAWGWSLILTQIYLLVGGLTEANFFDAEVNHIWIFSWALVLALLAQSERQFDFSKSF